MASYRELVAQREALEKQIAEQRSSEVGEAVRRIQEWIEAFGLTEADVFPNQSGKGKKASSQKGSKAAAKYRDPQTGVTWSGRGKAPRWFDKENASAFTIE